MVPRAAVVVLVVWLTVVSGERAGPSGRGAVMLKASRGHRVKDEICCAPFTFQGLRPR
jgi:hypothetical protein